jgi:hypothetical protein
VAENFPAARSKKRLDGFNSFATTRVARCYFFIPKIPIPMWGYFGGLGLENGKKNIIGPFGMFTDMAIRYILLSFGIFFSQFGMLYREKSGNPDHNK